MPRLRWRVAHYFTSYSRQRGSEMVREGAVEIVDATDGRVVTRVREGPGVYVVVVTAIRRELQVECTCPVFALGRDACRHLWAALVAVDRAGHLAKLRRPSLGFALVRARRSAS
jgi:uncharacterized Zn finger protein